MPVMGRLYSLSRRFVSPQADLTPRPSARGNRRPATGKSKHGGPTTLGRELNGFPTPAQRSSSGFVVVIGPTDRKGSVSAVSGRSAVGHLGLAAQFGRYYLRSTHLGTDPATLVRIGSIDANDFALRLRQSTPPAIDFSNHPATTTKGNRQ